MAEVRIEYDTIPKGITADSTTTANYSQSFVNFNDFKAYKNVGKYATLEKDYWILDGSFTNFPTSPSNIGYISTIQSDANGNFSNAIVITRTYGSNYSTQGIVLECETHTHNYAKNINIKWYRDTTLLADKDFVADSDSYLCEYPVQAFNKIVITVTSTNNPNRFLKIFNINDGNTRIFIKDEIINLDVLEEVSIDNSSLSINTLDIQLLPNAEYGMAFQRTLPMKVYRNENFIGCYYIDTYEKDNSTSTTIYKISATDYIGLLDYQSYLGRLCNGITASTLITEILGDIPYSLDSSLANITLTGWIPVCTKREALRLVAFAICGIIDTSRSDVIKIKKMPTSISSTIPASRIITNTLKEETITTEIALTTHTYKANTTEDATELYNQALTGTAYVTFNAPMHTLSITNGTITKSGDNYAIISGTGSTVVLTGKGYDDNTIVTTKTNPLAVSTDLEKVKDYETTLNSSADILSYLEFESAKITAKFKLESESVGDIVSYNGTTARIISLDFAPNYTNLYASATLGVLNG